MLGPIENFLRRRDLLGVTEKAHCNISSGKSTSVQVLVENGYHLHLKISTGASLMKEYETLKEVYAVLPKIVPKPIALEKIGLRDVIISEGVKHGILNKFDSLTINKQIIETFNKVNEVSLKHFLEKKPKNNHAAMVNDSALTLNQLDLAQPLNKWLSEFDFSPLKNIPYVKQHGDLASNNVGVYKKDIYIFDWEDFGRVLLPGYDMFLFAFTYYKLDLDKMDFFILSKSNNFLNQILKRYFANTGMDIHLFKKMYVAYIILFLCSKRDLGYSKNAQDQWAHCLRLALDRDGFS